MECLVYANLFLQTSAIQQKCNEPQIQVIYITLNFPVATIKGTETKKVKLILIADYNSVDPNYYHYKIHTNRGTFLITQRRYSQYSFFIVSTQSPEPSLYFQHTLVQGFSSHIWLLHCAVKLEIIFKILFQTQYETVQFRSTSKDAVSIIHVRKVINHLGLHFKTRVH